MMQTLDLVCHHCGSRIRDPQTQVSHGGLVYCCTNCAAAEEQEESGRDPRAVAREQDLLRCDYCGTPISDESTMRRSGNEPYCCQNCLLMAA